MRETLVILHVMLVMSSVVVSQGPVSVTVGGVVLKPFVQEVGFVCSIVEKVLVLKINNYTVLSI